MGRVLPMRFGGVFFFVFFALLPYSALAAVAPGQNWRTLTTPHFRVHHTPLQAPFAMEFSRELEAVLLPLSQKLSWQPEWPIDVLIHDRSDDANGLALSFPINRLEVYAVPFPGESTLGEYNNWVRELAIHELTHIIANDTAYGTYSFLRQIFGSIIKPNGLQPTWMVEGLAVYQETAFSSGGRGRSAISEAIFRAADWNDFSLDRLNEGPYWWPGGNTPYLFGYLAQTALGDPGKASADNASSWPYTMNALARRSTGHTWTPLWEMQQQKIKSRYSNENFAVPTEAPCYLTRSGYFTGGHALSRDGKIYFTLSHPDTGDALARMDQDAPCNENSWEVLVKKTAGGPEHVSVSASGALVAYSATATYRTYFEFNDLYLYDVKAKKSRRLTYGERASDPTFTDKENEILYIRNTGDGRQRLQIFDTETKAMRPLFEGKYFERLAHPVYFSGRIYFSRHNNKGQEEILWIPFDRSQREILTEDQAKPAISLASSAKGAKFFERQGGFDTDGNFYFTANYPEIFSPQRYQLFRLKNGEKIAAPIADSKSGLWWRPRIQQDLLFLAEYTADGFEIRRLNLLALPTQKLNGSPQSQNFSAKAQRKIASVNSDLHQFLTAQGPAADPSPTSLSAVDPAQTEVYDSFSTPAASHWPQYWRPVFSLVPGGIHAGAATSGLDALERHRYSLLGLYDSRSSFPLFDISYSNHIFPAKIYLQSEQTNSYLQSIKRSNKITTHSAQLVFPYNNWSFSTGLAQQTRFFLQSRTVNFFLFNSAGYSDAGKNPSAIAPNYGKDFQLYLGLYPKTKFDQAFADARPRFSIYFPGFHPDHSLMLHWRGGITTNRFLASNYYMGGGPDPLSENAFSVRGYPTDALLGQKILTANFSYTLPLARIYQGWHTNPIFLKTLGMRFLLDAGSANYLSEYRDQLIFLGYGAHRFGRKWIAGAGVDLLLNSTLLYYVPTEFIFGVHYGFQPAFGGGFSGYLGIKTAIDLISTAKSN